METSDTKLEDGDEAGFAAFAFPGFAALMNLYMSNVIAKYDHKDSLRHKNEVFHELDKAYHNPR